MIKCYSWNNHEYMCKLYEEWTGDFAQHLLLANTHFAIAKNERGWSVGAAQWIVINDPVWHQKWALVENVYIAKDFRRQGIATKLMRFIEEEARKEGCKFLKLTSNKEEGQSLYQSLGYEEGKSFKCKL